MPSAQDPCSLLSWRVSGTLAEFNEMKVQVPVGLFFSLSFFFFPFLFWPPVWHMELLAQGWIGSDLSGDLSHSCGNGRSLTYRAGLGSNLRLRAPMPQWELPLPHLCPAVR